VAETAQMTTLFTGEGHLASFYFSERAGR
jgi:hypothetical protein